MNYLIETTELNQTLELMITPMMLTNEAGDPVYLNKAFKAQIGYCVEEIPDGDSWLEKAYPDVEYRVKIINNWDALYAIQDVDEHVHLISKIYCVDGAYRWFEVHRHAIGNRYALTFLNVDELKQQADDLTDMVKQKETLLSIIAHDVRSPLSGSKQIVNSHENIKLTDDDVKNLFYNMSNQVDHVFNILNSLLLRVGDERGRFKEQCELIDLEDFFAKYLIYYKERLRDQNINLVLELPQNAVINYDPGILDVICRNLLDNAIKYTDVNGAICISYKKTANHSKLLIRDTGPGMSREQVDSILNNNCNYKDNKQLKNGFGLGLILAKEILERYHGKLSIKSEMGIGTSFIIDITDHPLN